MPKGETLPMAQTPDLKPGEIAKDTRLALKLATLPKINVKDAEQIKQRCELYFNFCIENDTRPTVQGLCLSMNTNRQSLQNWESENSARGDAIRGAKQIIRTLIEQWSVSGRLSPPVAIFWSKNYLSMKDTVTVEAVNNTGMRADKSPEEIEAEIISGIPVDDEE